MRRHVCLMSILLILILLLASSCRSADPSASGSPSPKNNASASEKQETEAPTPAETEAPEVVGRYSCIATKNQIGGEVTITFLQKSIPYPEYEEEEKNRIWNGLMYELEGEGWFYQQILETAPKSGRVWELFGLHATLTQYLDVLDGAPQGSNLRLIQSEYADSFVLTSGSDRDGYTFVSSAAESETLPPENTTPEAVEPETEAAAPIETETHEAVARYSCAAEEEVAGGEIQITFFRVDLPHPEYKEGEKYLIWNGLMYEVKGDGWLYQQILELSPESGRVWEKFGMHATLTQYLETLDGVARGANVRLIWDPYSDTFTLTPGATSGFGVTFDRVSGEEMQTE